MLHPNNLAINYIWEKFMSVWIKEDAQQTMTEVEIIQKGLSHKPFNPNSEAHQKFIESIQKSIEIVKSKYNHITF